MNETYPIKKYDSLNRLIYIDWNGYERIVKKYWNETNNVKIKYKYFGKEIVIDGYDELGNIIMSFDRSSFNIKLERFKMDENGDFEFKVEKKNIKNWKKLLKNSKFKPDELSKFYRIGAVGTFGRFDTFYPLMD